jgi:3-isopropylmalate/(R)-2-methylmalate dehydratase small subunit
VARSFADIFKQNATKNGLVPVALSDTECRRIEDARKADPKLALRVDLAEERVSLPDGTAFSFAVDPFAKRCLLNGIDELGYILSFAARIREHEERTAT